MAELRPLEELRVTAEKVLSQHHPRSEWAASGRNEPLHPETLKQKWPRVMYRKDDDGEWRSGTVIPKAPLKYKLCGFYSVYGDIFLW